MRGPTAFTQDVLKDVVWSVDRSNRHEHTAHINIQEVREVFEELSSRTWMSLVPARLCNIIDSRVTLG